MDNPEVAPAEFQSYPVSCRFCLVPIYLNEDTQENRDKGEDPAQQLRKHLQQHFKEMIELGRISGWLIDRLAFVRDTNEQAWNQSSHDVLDWLTVEVGKLAKDLLAKRGVA